MSKPGDILISVNERHAVNMLTGKKTVELRRKQLNISQGTRVWIYSKLPKGQIQALAVVEDVVGDSPEKIWADFGAQSAISKKEFDGYFENAKIGYAVVLESVSPLAPILSLSSIRNELKYFHPPQFFKKLETNSPELAFFETAISFRT